MREARTAGGPDGAAGTMGEVTIQSDDGDGELVGGAPRTRASAAARIAEIRALIHDLDDTPHTEMTGLYYLHGFNELDLAVRDLLHIIDTGLVPTSV